MVSRGFNDST
jgi:hypothetical protein